MYSIDKDDLRARIDWIKSPFRPLNNWRFKMASTASNAITLRFDDEQQRVVVHPDDSDRFVMTASEAAKALRMFDQLDVMRFHSQFQLLLNHLGTWMAKNRNKLQRGILTRCEVGLLFVVCGLTPSYDSDLEDLLSDLDIEVANNSDFSKIRLSVRSIPSATDESVVAFTDPDLYLELRTDV
jgi:hypothetical protein